MNSAPQRRQQAFTVTEVLAVLAITACVVVLAYPTLVKARDVSLQAKCASNIKLVGTGILTWAAENNGRLPAYGRISNNTGQTPTWGMKAAAMRFRDTVSPLNLWNRQK